MDNNSFQKLVEWVSTPIEVTIHGEDDEDQGPLVQRFFYKFKPCPDRTHMRVYFDSIHFVAFPLDSRLDWMGDTFQAYDQHSKIYYRIRKGSMI